MRKPFRRTRCWRAWAVPSYAWAGQLFIDADFRQRRFVAVVLLIVSVAIPNLLVDALLLFVWIYSADLITPGVLSFFCLAVALQAAMGWFAWSRLRAASPGPGADAI